MLEFGDQAPRSRANCGCFSEADGWQELTTVSAVYKVLAELAVASRRQTNYTQIDSIRKFRCRRSGFE
jgi:hypothetical protein